MAATFGKELASFKQLTSGLSGFELCTATNGWYRAVWRSSGLIAELLLFRFHVIAAHATENEQRRKAPNSRDCARQLHRLGAMRTG